MERVREHVEDACREIGIREYVRCLVGTEEAIIEAERSNNSGLAPTILRLNEVAETLMVELRKITEATECT
ncbi:MAG: hypothetical protein ACYTEQ_26365 [Planctomycetota bacterium]|jgi:hypothetical protein